MLLRHPVSGRMRVVRGAYGYGFEGDVLGLKREGF